LTSGFLDKPGDKSECKIMQDLQIYCKSPAARASVSKRLEKVCAAAEKGDAGIYTYMAFAAQENDTQVRIYSRYKDRAAMEKHIRQKEVIDFWKESKDDIDRMDHRAYFPNGKGWLHR
jgi:quinol monooxygenase YgiN